MLLVRFPLNSRPQIVKVLHGFLSVCGGVNVPNPPPVLFKGQGATVHCFVNMVGPQ